MEISNWLIDYYVSVLVSSISIIKVTASVSYLNDVADDKFSNLNLFRRSGSDDVERLLALDPVLQTSKLFLLGPVVKGCHEDDDDYGNQDGDAFDPAVIIFFDLAN